MGSTKRRTGASGSSASSIDLGEGRLREPSGLLPGPQRTKSILLRRLLNGEATVDELAAVTEVDRTVARRHMANLLGAGLVTAHPLRGSRGRPKTLYAITTEGREVFFARYDVLLDCLTRASIRRSGPRQTRLLYGEAAKTLAKDLGFPASPGSVIQTLREVGFEPELRTERGRRLVISHNCPVLRQARKNPGLVCETFHSGLLNEALVGTHAQVQQTMAKGAAECIHLLSPK